jgi:tetratricopeptide (TPR) repeat protein
MKICPFMSHMLGNEANILEVDTPGDAVGADDRDGGVGLKTDRKTRTAKDTRPVASHLYCLRDTCRFYRSKDGECTFDAILEQASRASEAGTSAQKESAASLAKELEKFWKFQTKSAAELISSFGEVEKRQEESLERMVRDLETRMSRGRENEKSEQAITSIHTSLSEMKDTMDARNEGFETLTTSVSDLVLGFDDSVKSIKDQWTRLSGQIASLESMVPRLERMESAVTKTIENMDRLERNWAELVDVVRTDNKKKADDSNPAAQAKRREAMKFNNLGVTSFHNGHLELARDQFLDAVRRDDTFAECFNNLGLVYTELSQETMAAAAFLKAIKLNPDLHAAYNNLGYVHYKEGNYQKAVEMHKEAVARSANNSSAYTNLGNAHFKLGQKAEARAAWQKAIELDPANEKAQRSLKSLTD